MRHATSRVPSRRSRALPTRALPALALSAALALTACTAGDGAADLGIERPSATSEESAPETAGPAAPAQECENPTASYEPAADIEAVSSEALQEIRDRGRLVVGVSSDTYLMGARNSFTGQLEGFDIDVARDIAEAILGDPGALELQVITSADRIPVLQSGDVDLVVRAFTITCERWDEIAFSAEYYRSGQKLLVATDSEATSLEDLAALGDSRVCAPAGTTTMSRVEEYDVTAVGGATHSACLVLFQQGLVDAVAGDDTILAGLAAQDPYAKIVGEPISTEPYGVGVAAQDRELVAVVNAVLEQRVADGAWAESYERWLADPLDAEGQPPEPVYGRS